MGQKYNFPLEPVLCITNNLFDCHRYELKNTEMNTSYEKIMFHLVLLQSARNW